MPEEKQVTLGDIQRGWNFVKDNIDYLFAYIRGTPRFGRSVANAIDSLDKLMEVAAELERAEEAEGPTPEQQLHDEASKKVAEKLGVKVARRVPGARKGRPNVRRLPTRVEDPAPEPEPVDDEQEEEDLAEAETDRSVDPEISDEVPEPEPEPEAESA